MEIEILKQKNIYDVMPYLRRFRKNTQAPRAKLSLLSISS